MLPYTIQVYPITRYVRGRVLLVSNSRYQALRLLQDIFTQMNYAIKIETEKSAQVCYLLSGLL